jgi:hypothetical protein
LNWHSHRLAIDDRPSRALIQRERLISRPSEGRRDRYGPKTNGIVSKGERHRREDTQVAFSLEGQDSYRRDWESSIMNPATLVRTSIWIWSIESQSIRS